METVVTLPICPSVNNLFASSSRRRHKTKEYAAWIEEAGYAINRQRPEPILGKVSLLIEIGEPDDKIRRDCSNFVKAPEDLLVRHGIIQGDDQRYVRSVTAEWSRHIEGIRITVTPLD
jgi:Holliday junction resolvase RusA-like endonuclease